MPECPSGQDIGSGSRWTVLECTGRKAVGPTKPILGQLSEAQTRQSRWNPGAGSNPAAPTNFGKQQTKRRKQMNTKPNPKRKQKGFIILYFAVVALITYGAAAVAVMESINQ